ncbi:MAG TPA: metallophosphoesterase [Dongiaceae bacterium]|nr:metallophosphoesterase [Dongiaceae bacterium]
MIIGRENLSGYDVIGDVHGCASSLCRLLQQLGYREEQGAWRHPERKAVFVGDIIDRGEHIRDAMRLVRKMVDAGNAYLVLGNHEYNAVAFGCNLDEPDDSPRRRFQARMARHLRETLQEYRHHEAEWCDTLAWLRQQPLCLEFPKFRVVHACWDADRIDQVRSVLDGCALRDDDFLHDSMLRGTEPHRVVERLLKGTDLVLPDGMTLVGADGIERNRIRTKFWKQTPATYGDVLFQPDKLPEAWMQRALTAQDRERLLHYGRHEKALFVGHYWRQGTPKVIRDNIACLDYGAVKGGHLVAYRMGAEERLSNEQFTWVQADDYT